MYIIISYAFCHRSTQHRLELVSSIPVCHEFCSNFSLQALKMLKLFSSLDLTFATKKISSLDDFRPPFQRSAPDIPKQTKVEHPPPGLWVLTGEGDTHPYFRPTFPFARVALGQSGFLGSCLGMEASVGFSTCPLHGLFSL